MGREKKSEIIDRLEDIFSRCSIGILTDYRGLTNAEITSLRRRIQGAGGEYKVVKNTLARFAAERAGVEELVDRLEGPIAIAFGYDDITEPAKAITDYKKALEIFPDYLLAHYNIALSNMKLRDIDKAIEHFGRVVELAPDSDLARQSKSYLLVLK